MRPLQKRCMIMRRRGKGTCNLTVALAFAAVLLSVGNAHGQPCSGDATQLLFPLDASYSVVPMSLASPPQYRNDDDSSLSIPLGFTFDLYGDLYTSVFVNNNGNLSFVTPLTAYTAGFPDPTFQMVAPFLADVDTRAAGSGLVWMKQYDSNGDTVDDTLIATWDNVGYFLLHDDLLNTFQVAISDGSNPAMGLGNNVCFSWDNMCWTTGDFSGGSGGFGGTPATVGANRGNGIDFFQIGRFDHEGTDYDGPFGSNDGVSHLDQSSTCFSTSTTNANIAPIPTGFPPGNQLTVDTCLGGSVNLTLQFLSPEALQTTTVTITDPDGAQAAGLVITNTPGNVATVTLSWPTPVVGTYNLQFTATDDFNPTPGMTNIALQLDVICSQLCGNNVREGTEACDGTDAAACPGLCDPNCQCVSPGCGNNIREGAEDCDGTDDAACPGLCNATCQCPVSPVCGNNIREGTEDCDGTDDAACPGHCNPTCQCVACLDDADCDDQNPCTNDACNPGTGDCENPFNGLCPPGCGDLATAGNETCDPPDLSINPTTGEPVCRLDCTSCGDGMQNGSETCDDGNTVTGCRLDQPQKPMDGCNNNCTIPMCKDPARIAFGRVVDVFKLHGRLTMTAGRTIDVAGQSFTVELTRGREVLYRADLLANSMQAGGSSFWYKNLAAQAGFGVVRLRLKKRPDGYLVTFLGSGNLKKAAPDMVTRIHIGNEEWTSHGLWQWRMRSWRLIDSLTP